MLRLYKRILSSIALIPNYCKLCGSWCSDFRVSNELWEDVTNNSTKEICPNCFYKIAENKNIETILTYE